MLVLRYGNLCSQRPIYTSERVDFLSETIEVIRDSLSQHGLCTARPEVAGCLIKEGHILFLASFAK